MTEGTANNTKLTSNSSYYCKQAEQKLFLYFLTQKHMGGYMLCEKTTTLLYAYDKKNKNPLPIKYWVFLDK